MSPDLQNILPISVVRTGEVAGVNYKFQDSFIRLVFTECLLSTRPWKQNGQVFIISFLFPMHHRSTPHLSSTTHCVHSSCSEILSQAVVQDWDFKIVFVLRSTTCNGFSYTSASICDEQYCLDRESPRRPSAHVCEKMSRRG